MDRKIKFGIIGCGKVGHFHAKALIGCPHAELVGVSNRNFERAEAFGRQYGVPAFATIEEMSEKTGVEAVSICTTHPTHAEYAVKAASCGIHLLVEKPLASSIEDCDSILQAAAKNGVKVSTVCQRRFYKPSLRLKKAIDDGKIGRPILGIVTMLGWRDKKYYDSDDWRGTWDGEGGGILVNQAPHQLDLLLWYMGEISEVYGTWSNLNHPYIDVDDTAIAVIKFKNGGLGSIVVSNCQNPALYGKVHIFGENGSSVGVQTDGGAMFIAGMSTITEPPINDLWTVPGEEDMFKDWKEQDREFFNSVDSMYYFHRQQINDFVESIMYDREPIVTGLDGRRTVELFTSIYRCHKENLPIKFPL